MNPGHNTSPLTSDKSLYRFRDAIEVTKLDGEGTDDVPAEPEDDAAVADEAPAAAGCVDGEVASAHVCSASGAVTSEGGCASSRALSLNAVQRCDTRSRAEGPAAAAGAGAAAAMDGATATASDGIAGVECDGECRRQVGHQELEPLEGAVEAAAEAAAGASLISGGGEQDDRGSTVGSSQRRPLLHFSARVSQCQRTEAVRRLRRGGSNEVRDLQPPRVLPLLCQLLQLWQECVHAAHPLLVTAPGSPGYSPAVSRESAWRRRHAGVCNARLPTTH